MTEEVITSEVLLKLVIIPIILLLSTCRSTITDVASFVLVSAVCVELIVAIEPLLAEAALRMSLESTLIYSARIVIAKSFMFAQLLVSKELVLVCEDLLVPCAQITVVRFSDKLLQLEGHLTHHMVL